MIPRWRESRKFWAATLWAWLVFSGYLRADEPDEDDPAPRRPGLLARIKVGQEAIERVELQPVVDGSIQALDRRIQQAVQAEVRWTGQLSIQADGAYRFFVYAGGGRARLSVAGQELLDQECGPVGLWPTPAIDLEFGQHSLEIHFAQKGETARHAIYWSGPGFAIEPLAPRWLSHAPSAPPTLSVERGEALVRALRCAACHDLPGEPVPLAAPALDRLSGNLERTWLTQWLAEASHDKPTPSTSEPVARRMPGFGFSRDEAAAVAEYLLTANAIRQDPAPFAPSSELVDELAEGKSLFLSLGCLACHRLGELGRTQLFDGGDLTHIRSKRPASFFARWLAEPEKINRQHRMPVFELSRQELSHLSAFLASLPPAAAGQQPRSELESRESKQPVPSQLAVRGEQIFVRARCTACHAGPGVANRQSFQVSRLSAQSNWKQSCLHAPDPTKNRPGYQLESEAASAVRQFVGSLAVVDRRTENRSDGRKLLIEHNCLACHARDESLGLAPLLPEVAEVHPALAEFVAAMTPPSLSSVGDKLRDEALTAAVRRTAGNHQPYLKVRMPKFALPDAELEALVQYFISADRMPEAVVAAGTIARPGGNSAAVDSELFARAGARLVTSDGFGCTSCHQVGKALPVKAPVNARGPDLTLVAKRIRREWFDRWCRDPARIVPRIEMPAVKVPVRGVLDDDLTAQLAAVWKVLNTAGFQPPEPTVQVLRLSGAPDKREGAETITDVLHADGRTLIRPLLIGLPNRQNVLFDCETGRLSRWSVGDVARQRTQGKTWFWEAEGEDLLRSGVVDSDLVLVQGDKTLMPTLERQFTAEPEMISRTGQGISFHYRLAFAVPGSGVQRIEVTQEVTPFGVRAETKLPGFRRRIQASLPVSGWDLKLRVVSTARWTEASPSSDGRTITLSTTPKTSMEVSSGATRFDADGSLRIPLERKASSASGDVSIDYFTEAPAGLWVPPAAPAILSELAELTVAPGFRATRLPLPGDIMPTALAWREDGSLVIASLKGRIWLARDTNQDSLEDEARPFSDEIAAPFGLATEGQDVLACAKYGLLRLRDADGDGRAEETSLVASGWGYTEDYHDWTFGLPSDGQGGYFLALACQQDKRTEAAARLRGKVVHAVPRTPTNDDPRSFELQVVSGGHRFPTGLARSRGGDLFVTDNQGNYNPFNELNHVRHGLRYGFINALEQRPDFKPPAEPAAINIPHPWTRSVNGICFLETPEAVRSKLGKSLFGPFEGHLLGCEYDTRRLIRMSLQRIGDTYQGAAYPFSREGVPEDEAMLGPLCCAVSPAGDIYVGSIRDSGWGAGNNFGEIIRLRSEPAELPAGVGEVRAVVDGFEIDFTANVDPRLAADPKNYSVLSYRRVLTPAYGGPDVDRRDERIQAVHVSQDARRVRMQLADMRPGFVYQFHLKNLAGAGQTFFPAEVHFTLRSLP